MFNISFVKNRISLYSRNLGEKENYTIFDLEHAIQENPEVGVRHTK